MESSTIVNSASDPLPKPRAVSRKAFVSSAMRHPPESAAAIGLSDDLIAEIKAADHIVIGTPMFNFSIPAVLKAYIGQIVRVGVTVSPNNAGLLTGKKATIIVASGSDFSPGSPAPYVEKCSDNSMYYGDVERSSRGRGCLGGRRV